MGLGDVSRGWLQFGQAKNLCQSFIYVSACVWVAGIGEWYLDVTIFIVGIERLSWMGMENFHAGLSWSEFVIAGIWSEGELRDFFSWILHGELLLASFEHTSWGAATSQVLLTYFLMISGNKTRANVGDWGRIALWWQRLTALLHKSHAWQPCIL